MKDYKNIILNLKATQEARIQAAFKLENIADDESLAAMIKCLQTDPSPIVRHEAAFSLGETACPKIAGPALVKAIKEDKDIFVRHEALLALGTLDFQEATEFIESLLSDKDHHISESAEIALQRLSNI
jgi:deoxyhypusine monooxygenase